ncbi:hypothetical protein JCM9279_002155 [Rhodotorula babjevae]
MADTAGSPPPSSSRKRRARSGVDASLIIDAPRKRKHMGVELGGPSTRHGGRSGSPNPATIPATDPEGFERVREQGTQLYERMVAQTDPSDPARPLYYAFSELPSRDDYPDYYKMIKKPISFAEIKAKLDARQYACLSDLRTDINQIYVNAKRYNAPGSQIFLDAKKQHKLLKDTYAVMTGEAPPPEEHDEPEEAPQPAPAPRARQSGGGRGGGGAEAGGAAAGGKAATLRPWLNGKLDDVTALEDANGRNYAENFHVLPDRGLWPDYYQLIAEPMAFETVRARVQRNHYKAVEPFYQDVMTIFENAMFYNEDSSRIWKDAMVLKKHFGDIMQEEPPEYVPAKKSHKRRLEPDISVSDPAKGTGARGGRQSSTFVGGEDGAGSEAGGYEDEDASEDEASRHGSVVPAAQQQQPFAGVVQPKPEDIPIGDPYALPGGSPALAATLALPDNPLLGLASASAALLNSPFPAPGAGAGPLASPSFGTLFNGSSSPTMPLNGRPLHAAPTAPDAPTTFHPRLVARLSAPGSSAPLLLRFEVRCTPSGASFTLDTALARQHAFAIPSDTQRVEISPVLAGASPSSTSRSASSKGKGRAAANGAAAGAGAARVVAARARPAALVSLVEEAAELPPAPPRADGTVDLDVAVDGGASRSGAKRYALVEPRAGLSTLEFVVGPAGAAGAGDGQEDGQVQALREGEEVYRLFVTR